MRQARQNAPVAGAARACYTFYSMKKLDGLIIAIVIALSLLPLPFLFPGADAGTVVVTVRGAEIYRASLATDAVIVTPDGGNTITVKDGTVTMTAASCPDGLCVAAGPAKPGKPVVCLPNGVVVAIEAAKEPTDAIAY